MRGNLVRLRSVRATSATVLLSCVVAAAVAAQPASATVPRSSWWPATTSAPIVTAPAGTFEGTSSDQVQSFRGIRYAQAPLGELRWSAPKAEPPAPELVKAVAYSKRCSAPKDTNGPESLNEDCLFLNVQRPTGLWSWSRRPVLVWIHGGSNLTGGADQHDGELIARSTGSIVVTMNYRLGALGFLAHPALSAEGDESGNFGFQDQQEALRWVRDNISAFGGDPRQVTIGGESSGGLDVCGHLTSPGSRGLFRAAILQSGTCASTPLATAEKAGLLAAESVGCAKAATALACLRALPVSRLLPIFPTSSPPPLVRDTGTFPTGPRQAVADGHFKPVPIMVGSNLDDGRTFTADMTGWDKSLYESTIVGQVGQAQAPKVLARYPWPASPGKFTAAYLVGSVLTDSNKFVGVGACLTHRLVEDLSKVTTVYEFEFAHRTGPGLRPIPGYVWGAGHAAELPYLFPSFDNGTPIAATFDRSERQLSQTMVRAWGEFVAKSDPEALGLPSWKPYNLSRELMSLRSGFASTSVPSSEFTSAHQCDFWDPQSNDLT
jgi:carboxylesterase type B